MPCWKQGKGLQGGKKRLNQKKLGKNKSDPTKYLSWKSVETHKEEVLDQNAKWGMRFQLRKWGRKEDGSCRERNGEVTWVTHEWRGEGGSWECGTTVYGRLKRLKWKREKDRCQVKRTRKRRAKELRKGERKWWDSRRIFDTSSPTGFLLFFSICHNYFYVKFI